MLNQDNITKKYIKYALIAAITVAVIWLFPHVWRLISPFVVALIIAIPCNKLVNFLERKWKVNRALSSAIIVVSIIFLVGGIATYLVYQLILEIQTMIANIPATLENFGQQLDGLLARYAAFLQRLPLDWQEFLDNLPEQIQDGLMGLVPQGVGGAARAAGNVATSVASMLFYSFILILSAFFLIKDYDVIMAFLRKNVSDSFAEKAKHIRKTISLGFLSYIKAQLIIMTITFIVSASVLLILGTNHAIVAAFFIALVDFIPVFGTGIILIPWGIISLIYGDFGFAITLFILQAVCFIGRNMITPKLLSTQIGIHPILTIIGMFVGLRLFGVAGLIIGPILALLAVSLYNAVKSTNEIE
jgi:sporulation integral membrane protein YtvI